jgi:acyl-CoA synthetase (AMP-forming)/AMP-acid ligase II
MNVFDLLDRPARRFPDHGAVYLGVERWLTFAQLRDRALRLAGSLARGRPGDRVALVSENRPEYIEILFAIWAAGQTAVPINAKLHPREIVAILEDAGASTLLVSPDLASEVVAAAPEAMRASVTTIEIGSPGYARLLNAPPVVPADMPTDALAWLFYTSGTTGRSKGAMLSHRNLMAMTLSYLADVSSPDETTSLIHGAPMSHGSGLYILPFIGRGARQVVPESAGFDPGEFLDLCDQHPGCGAFLAPTMVQRLRLEAERRQRRPANLRTIVYGGGPMYVEELKKAMAVFGPVFAQIYGQGEAPMTITGLRAQDHDGADDAVLGSVG